LAATAASNVPKQVAAGAHRKALHHGICVTCYSNIIWAGVFTALPDAILGPQGAAARGLVQRGYLHSCSHNIRNTARHSAVQYRIWNQPCCCISQVPLTGIDSARAQWVYWFMHCTWTSDPWFDCLSSSTAVVHPPPPLPPPPHTHTVFAVCVPASAGQACAVLGGPTPGWVGGVGWGGG
jgi:hypothetical protein